MTIQLTPSACCLSLCTIGEMEFFRLFLHLIYDLGYNVTFISFKLLICIFMVAEMLDLAAPHGVYGISDHLFCLIINQRK